MKVQNRKTDQHDESTCEAPPITGIMPAKNAAALRHPEFESFEERAIVSLMLRSTPVVSIATSSIKDIHVPQPRALILFVRILGNQGHD
jgi:hypothetical protein